MDFNILRPLALLFVYGHRSFVTGFNEEKFAIEFYNLLTSNDNWTNINHVESYSKLPTDVEGQYYTIDKILGESTLMKNLKRDYLLTVDLIGCVYMDVLLKYLNLMKLDLSICQKTRNSGEYNLYKDCLSGTLLQIKYSTPQFKNLYAAMDTLGLFNRNQAVPVCEELSTYLNYLDKFLTLSESKLNMRFSKNLRIRKGVVKTKDWKWEHEMDRLVDFVRETESSLNEFVVRKCKLHDKNDMDLDELWKYYKIGTDRGLSNENPVADIQIVMTAFWKIVKFTCYKKLGFVRFITNLFNMRECITLNDHFPN